MCRCWREWWRCRRSTALRLPPHPDLSRPRRPRDEPRPGVSAVAPRLAAIDACRRRLVCLARIVRINQRPRHPTMRANLPIRTDHSLFARDRVRSFGGYNTLAFSASRDGCHFQPFVASHNKVICGQQIKNLSGASWVWVRSPLTTNRRAFRWLCCVLCTKLSKERFT
jgi:hypothetical protein